ncbi:hypothetical protein MBEBAB_2486 [Brevundimonas abyssalis TAR-001]|uniref:Uncharacterized protein n=1 Tax=Brevundimonas abyssalis TAR-001 TaxID=1391729 RepID=A0A8E0TTG1_9CAUL|nr:hypothetical protein MBEBAB_2486 [Brevundimonas abyssalis TAR-001]
MPVAGGGHGLLCVERPAPGGLQQLLGRAEGVGGGLLGGLDGVEGGLVPVDLRLQLGQAGALLQPDGGGAGRLGPGHEAVPAEQVALNRHQTGAHGQTLGQVRRGLPRGDPAPAQAGRQLRRRRDLPGQRLHAVRPRGRRRVRTGPVGRGAGVQGRVQIVAQRGGQRGFIAPLGPHLIQRRGKVALGGGQQLGQPPRLGLQAAQPVLQLAGFLPRFGLRAGGVAPGGFGGLHSLAGGAQVFQRGVQRGAGLGDLWRLQRAQRLPLAVGVVEGLAGAGDTGLGVTLAGRLGVGAGLHGGQRSGLTLHLAVGGGAGLFRRLQSSLKLRAPLGRGGDLGLYGFQIGGEAGQLPFGVGGGVLFALRVGGDARLIRGYPRDLVPRGLFGHVQPVPLQGGAVQQGGGDRVFLPGGLEGLLGGQGGGLGAGGVPCGLGHRLIRLGQLSLRGLGRHAGVVPAHIEQGCLQRADLGGDLLVLLGLPRLALEAGEGGLQLAADVVQPLQICLGGAQAQLGLVSAGMQARHPARLLEDAAAVLGLGGDQLRDLALAHKGGRVGPGGGVGEQQLHVARAHLLAVDFVGGALTPVDAAGHLQQRRVSKGLGGPPLGVVDGQLDLCVVAAGPPRRPGEDHVVHALTAHGLGRVGPHDPAQALQHIGLAAAVGPDDARQSRLDMEFHRVHEGLEARDA